MGFNERHSRRPSAVRDAPDARSSVVVRYIFHKPIDAIPRIRGLVDAVSILRIPWSAIHHELAFRFETASQVLPDKDIPVRDQFFEDSAGRSQVLVVFGNSIRSAGQ